MAVIGCSNIVPFFQNRYYVRPVTLIRREYHDIHTTALETRRSPMIGFESLPSAAEAILLIGIVLLEAMILYVGYGALEQVLGQRILKRIKNV